MPVTVLGKVFMDGNGMLELPLPLQWSLGLSGLPGVRVPNERSVCSGVKTEDNLPS